jgi:hypothetical protein
MEILKKRDHFGDVSGNERYIKICVREIVGEAVRQTRGTNNRD